MDVEKIAANSFVITVLVPFFITFMAVFVNWLIHGNDFERKHAMIGSDLVLCFIAIAAIHFFKIYRDNYVIHMDSMRMADLMAATFAMSLMTFPLLLLCVGMERASNVDEVPVTWGRLFTNFAFGASPLALAAFSLAS